jgi:hypothetical protein
VIVPALGPQRFQKAFHSLTPVLQRSFWVWRFHESLVTGDAHAVTA